MQNNGWCLVINWTHRKLEISTNIYLLGQEQNHSVPRAQTLIIIWQQAHTENTATDSSKWQHIFNFFVQVQFHACYSSGYLEKTGLAQTVHDNQKWQNLTSKSIIITGCVAWACEWTAIHKKESLKSMSWPW